MRKLISTATIVLALAAVPCAAQTVTRLLTPAETAAKLEGQTVEDLVLEGASLDAASTVENEAYSEADWLNDLTPPTKHALRAKLETTMDLGALTAGDGSVEIGAAADNDVLIMGGLTSGDRVVFGGRDNDSGNLPTGARIEAQTGNNPTFMSLFGTLVGDNASAVDVGTLRSRQASFYDESTPAFLHVAAWEGGFYFYENESALPFVSAPTGLLTINVGGVANAGTYSGALTIGSGDSLTVDGTISLTGSPSAELDIADGGILGILAFENTVAIGSQVSGLGSGVATAAAVDTNIAGGLHTVGGTMAGHLLFTDNTYDIGASGATRPRDVYLSRTIHAGTGGSPIILNMLGSSGVATFQVNGTGVMGFQVGGTPVPYVTRLSLGPTITTPNVHLLSDGAATLQLGLDAAGVTNQMIKGPDRITTDGPGASITVAGGLNRGASAAGSVIFSTAAPAAAGVAGVLSPRMEITGDGKIIIPGLPTSDPGFPDQIYVESGVLMISVP
jgi:hypothetical protein